MSLLILGLGGGSVGEVPRDFIFGAPSSASERETGLNGVRLPSLGGAKAVRLSSACVILPSKER